MTASECNAAIGRRNPVSLRFAWACALALLALTCGPAGAQETAFAGKWHLSLDAGRNPHYGVLEIFDDGDALEVYIDGGPVNLLELSSDRIVFDLDWTDGGDRLRSWELSGSLIVGRLSGEFSENDERAGTWSAEPWAEHPDAGAAPDPVDISGVWANLSRGTHKDAFDLTATARSIHDAYDPTVDDPHLRCVTGGVIRMEDGPFAQQIIQLDDQIVMLYGYFNEVRRIWMDGRDFPEGIESANLHMGYSIGRWEGSTLVVETRGMKPTVWDAKGMPVSRAAVVIERKYLDDDGRLHADYTLYDPTHFSRPVYRHAYWERRADLEVAESACDPHSFYRSLDLEGRLGEYWGRSTNRF